MQLPHNINAKLSKLGPESMRELERYLDYLLKKKSDGKSRKLSQSWAGGLKDIDEQAVALQKKALDWRHK